MSSDSRYRGYQADLSTKDMAADLTSLLSGTFLIFAGFFDMMQGLAAVNNDDVYAGHHGGPYGFDLTGWGWAHLILGAVAVLVAIGILLRAAWGQVAGLAVAGLVLDTTSLFAVLPVLVPHDHRVHRARPVGAVQPIEASRTTPRMRPDRRVEPASGPPGPGRA